MPIVKLVRKNHPHQFRYFSTFGEVQRYRVNNPTIQVTYCTFLPEDPGFDKDADYKMLRKIGFGKHFSYSDMKMAERIAGKIKGYHRLTNEERLFVKTWREADLAEEGVLV